MKKTFYNLIKISGLIMPSFVMAQVPTAVTPITNLTPSGIVSTITRYAGYFQTLILILTVLVFFYAGYLFMTSGGDPTAQTKAKSVLWWGIIGVAVVMAAYVAQTIINNFLTGA